MARDAQVRPDMEFDRHLILKHMRAHQNYPFEEGKDLCMFVGKTGHGKSTTINWLLGETIVVCQRDIEVRGFLKKVTSLSCPTQRPGLKIGFQPYRSETFFLHAEKMNANLYVCDSPGLGDTAGINVAVAHAAAMTRCLHRCSSVRIVLVISVKMLGSGGDKGVAFRQVLDEMREFINIDSDIYMPLVIYTHLEDDTTFSDVGCSLAELQEELQQDVQAKKFLEKCLDDLRTHKDALLMRPNKDSPDSLRKIISESPTVSNPREVFRCPLNLSLQKQLELACKQIKEEVQNDLDALKFKGISQSLDELRLLSRYTGIERLLQTYRETVQIVVAYFRHKLEAALRAFEDKAFSDTAAHLDAINENLLDHMQEQDEKQPELPVETDGGGDENAASISRSYSSLVDLINRQSEEWRITTDNVYSSNLAHLGQQLGWLRGVCVSLPKYLLERNQSLFKRSLETTIQFINSMNSRAIYLMDKHMVSAAQVALEKGVGEAKPVSLAQSLDSLRDVPFVQDFVDETLLGYYEQRRSALQALVTTREADLVQGLKALRDQPQRELLDVEAHVKYFDSLLRFSYSITAEFVVHLPGCAAGMYEDCKAKLADCASECERQIATHQRQYWIVNSELQKLEVMSRVLESSRFVDRLLEEYRKLEALARELSESVDRKKFENAKPRLDVLAQACLLMVGYLEKGWQIRELQEARKPKAVEGEPEVKAEGEPEVKEGKPEVKAEGKPELAAVDVLKSYADLKKTLERQNIEALNIAGLHATTDSESLKLLEDNLRQLEEMWEYKDHIPNLETNYSKLEKSFQAKFKELTNICLAESDPKERFRAEATSRNFGKVHGFTEVLRVQQGPRFGAPCAGFVEQLTTVRGTMVQNIRDRLANSRQASQKCVELLLDRTEKLNFSNVDKDLGGFATIVEGIVEIVAHLDYMVEQFASQTQTEVLKDLDEIVSKTQAKFVEFLSEKLDAAEAIRNFLQAMEVLKAYCPRIPGLNEEMSKATKAKKTDFAQCRINELQLHNYIDFIVAMQGGRAMEKGSSEDRKQWAAAKAALKTLFSVSYGQASALMRKLLSKRSHVGHEDATQLLNSIKHVLLLESKDESKEGPQEETTRGLAEFLPDATLWVQEVSKYASKLESELNKRFDLALPQRDFVLAELFSADLDVLCETAETLQFPYRFSSTTQEDREKRFNDQVKKLDEDISVLVKFEFVRPVVMHLDEEAKTPKLCTPLECKCSQCVFEASVDLLALEGIFEQLHKAKEKNLQLDDFSKIWQTQTRVLDQRIQALFAATRNFARVGQLKPAEECVRVAEEVRQSNHVKNNCSFTEAKLEQLVREVKEAGFNHQLSSFKYWASFPSKASDELSDLQWKDYPKFEKIKEAISNQLLSKAQNVDNWVREVKLDDNYTNGQIVPQISECFLVRDGLATHGIPPLLELDPVVDRLEALLERYAQQSQNCLKKHENIHNLAPLKWILSRFTRDLLDSKVERLQKLGSRFDPIIKNFIDNVDNMVSSTLQGWELVHAFDFEMYDMATNTKLVAYLNQLQKNSVLLSTVDDSKDVSFGRAVAELKSKVAELDNQKLWNDLVAYCSRPRSDPPLLKVVLANLKDLTKVPEVEAEKSRQEKVRFMKEKYDKMSLDLNHQYSECAKASSSDVQTQKIKELNRVREEASAVGNQLTEFMSVTSSDELVVKTLKQLANDTRKKYNGIAKPSKADLADYIVECYRIGLNVSMPQVKTHVHDLVKEVLAQARKQNVDFDDLAAHLENNYEEGIGLNVVEDFDDFKAFRLAAFQQKTSGKTFEAAIDELFDAKAIDANQKKKLEDAWKHYSKKYLEFGIMKPHLVLDRVDTLMKQIRKGKSGVELIVEALAGICARMALAFAVGINDLDPDQIKVRKNPHPVQILGIFRLLRVDAPTTSWVSSWLSKAASDSHLIQIGTGEGKSIALGVLSIFLALLGYDIDCVCYSDVLSKRDYAEFEALFASFGVKQKIFYGTFRELSRRFFNEQGDVREGTEKLLSQSLRRGDIKCKTPAPRILLIDEVDVLFSRGFYGAVYYPAATVKGSEVTAVLEYIWKNKGADMNAIAASQPYQTLKQKFDAKIWDILHTELVKMVAATKTYQASPHRVENGKIGIVEHGTTKYDLRDGYNTTCYYFQAMEQMSITQEEFDKHVALDITCGSFSYAEIPKDKSYKRILGMSGTLSCLGTYEREIMKLYDIQEQTIMPSLYGKRDQNFDEGVHYEEKLDEYFRKIAEEATTHSHKAELATLIFFETEQRLKQFEDSSYFPRDKDTNVVWTGEHLAHYVTNATKSRRITCFPKVFGRGTDFKCVDKKVVTKGVRVIQTFLSEDVSEEIQIKGRTCRQGDKGSYKMILFVDDLLNWGQLKAGKQLQQVAEAPPPLVTLADLKAEHKEGLAKFLGAKRDEWFNNQSKQRIEEVKLAEVSHQSTVEFQKNLVDANTELALKFVKSLNQLNQGCLHLVFCLDQSGSMSGSWNDLLAAYDVFLQEVSNAAPSSRISVIKFDEAAEVVGRHLEIPQARALRLVIRGGGTAFAPPLVEAFNMFQVDQKLDPCLVFMTDGENGSEDTSAALKQLATVQNLQSHFVYFGSPSAATQKVKALASSLNGNFHPSTDLKAVFKTVAQAVVSRLSHV